MRKGIGIFLALSVAALAGAAWPGGSRAESWCAGPMWVHEWGVQAFQGPGATGRRMGPLATKLPRYFHNQARARVAAGAPVRGMPVDSGMRALPVLHFYATDDWMPAPVAIEVGFTQGDAIAWYPQVDARVPARDANGAAARAARAQLVQQRAARANGRAFTNPALLPSDPTRQLQWDHLSLTRNPLRRRATPDVPWVGTLRGFGDALWVNSARESERFVFYEARTSERPALRVERGPTHAAGRRHLILRNTVQTPVHDVFFVHREGGADYVFYAPAIPAGQTAGFVLESHRVTAAGRAAATRDRLRTALVDPQQPRAPRARRWPTGECVMQRDPAIPVESASGHRLYEPEADVLIDLWGARFFDAPGTTIVYREDERYLDQVMPLSIYTDMYHHVDLQRAGLAVVEGVLLP